MRWIVTLANPSTFDALARRLIPWLAVATVGLFAWGLWLALVVSPPDYQQGETVRIMYVHVPAAWLGMGVYAMMAVASAAALIWKSPLSHAAAQEAAPLGAMFTAVCLITGSLWGKPMWGTWWVWDARLTSMLVLLFLYIGYMALAQGFEDRMRGARAAAILAIAGVVNLPIIKFSVDWWNTLHQPASVVRMDGPALDPAMLTPLLVMAAAHGFFFGTLLLVRMRAALARNRARVLWAGMGGAP